jgi:signal transduction histidine kinase
MTVAALPATTTPAVDALAPAPPVESWLASMEVRVILPVKWALFLLTIIYWYARQPIPASPSPEVFGVFAAFFFANLGHAYLCLFSGIGRRQARPFSLMSLAVDVAFLFALVAMNARFSAPIFASQGSIEFYIFFCILVLRGISVLRSPAENLVYALILAAALIWSLRLLEDSFAFLADSRFIFRFALVWVVFGIGWFLIASVRRTQEEIGEIRESMLLRENLAYLGEISAGVAHEINNPIAIIAACADSLQAMLPPDDDLREEAEMIRAEARRCQHIVRDLLGFAAPNRVVEVGPIDLRALVDAQLAPLVARDWSPPPRVVRDYASMIPIVRGDATRLGQAVRNILINANQHMGAGGTLSVAVAAAERGDRPVVLVRIADTGTGIDPEVLERLFEPFATRRRGGTGLGLAIAARIIDAHAGRIDVVTSPEEGTSMTIVLPAEEKSSPPYAQVALGGVGGANGGGARGAKGGAPGNAERLEETP